MNKIHPKNTRDEQYSLGKILFIRTIVTIPMPLSAFVIVPLFFHGDGLATWLFFNWWNGLAVRGLSIYSLP
jgi:hypothetical protein